MGGGLRYGLSFTLLPSSTWSFEVFEKLNNRWELDLFGCINKMKTVNQVIKIVYPVSQLPKNVGFCIDSVLVYNYCYMS